MTLKSILYVNCYSSYSRKHWAKKKRSEKKKKKIEKKFLQSAAKFMSSLFLRRVKKFSFGGEIQRSPSSLLIKFTASVKEMEVVGAEI